jgi:hypothetical protein
MSINRSVVMRLLHLALEKPNDFEELKTLIGSKGLDIIEEIRVETMRLPEENGDKSDVFYAILFQPSLHHGSKKFYYQNLSFGIRRLLRILQTINLIY